MDPLPTTLYVERQSPIVREPKVESTVARYLSGDKTAFAEIYGYLLPVINQVIHTKRYPGYIDHVEDITQECWMDAIKNLQNWSPERGTLKNFMFKCFANRTMVYLHKMNVSVSSVPIEDVEQTLPAEPKMDSSDLDISLSIRFSGDKERYVVGRVCVAVFLHVFDGCRNKLLRELRYMTGLSLRRIRFLIDYALVIVRKYSLEVECRTDISDTICAI